MTPRVALAFAVWQPPSWRRRHPVPTWAQINHAWIVLHELVMAAAEEDRRARS